MIVIVRQAPPDSALIRALRGPDFEWNTTTHLVAMAVDALNAANWQRAGGKQKDRPTPIPRPGIEQPRRHGGEAVSMEEMRARLEKRRHLSVVTED